VARPVLGLHEGVLSWARASPAIARRAASASVAVKFCDMISLDSSTDTAGRQVFCLGAGLRRRGTGAFHDLVSRRNAYLSAKEKLSSVAGHAATLRVVHIISIAAPRSSPRQRGDSFMLLTSSAKANRMSKNAISEDNGSFATRSKES
jgi:hypothetical protein